MTTANEELRERIMLTILANPNVSSAERAAGAPVALAASAFDWIVGVQKKPLPEPAVPIQKSITPDYIVCLEDGKKLKMLKRHLKAAYALTPEQYRERWGLPADYPMTAPNYAKKRSTLAKKAGLGKRPRASKR